MKQLLCILLLSCFSFSWSQNEQLADDYFKRGQFEKALITYQKLHENNKGNYKYIYKLVETYQQLEQYDNAQILLLERLNNRNNPSLMVELGYNYQLKGNQDLANTYYQDAINELDNNPSFTYSVAKRFKEHSLLEEAIATYEKGMALNPKQNFYVQLARIYGELGNVEQLFANYINYIETKPTFLNNGKRAFSDFISENSENENNVSLRRILLKKIQANPDEMWYDMLSWLYIQEKAYNKAFIQEKALYRRNPESLSRILELAITALNENEYEISTTIFNYVLESSQDIETQLTAHQFLLDIATTNATKRELKAIQDNYLELFEQYGLYEQTIALQIAYGHFLAFHLHDPEAASTFLKKSLKLELSLFQEATVKLKLGDILVFQEKFNEALIYYSQIQANLKNSTISQEARFKVAKTSYYKGDFEWAETQLKILKASTSQLIANDALDLKLLISDNILEDTLHTALKLYSKADLLGFQNKTEDAISVIDKILKEHKGESIEDQALFLQAKFYKKTKQFDKAEANYQYIIANYRDDILADDAHYFLGLLYETVLGEPEKAKPLYEKIIFDHEDSIYFIESRKRFRRLRGDAIN